MAAAEDVPFPVPGLGFLDEPDDGFCEDWEDAECWEFEAVVELRLMSRICFSRARISARTSSSATSRFCTVSSIELSSTF